MLFDDVILTGGSSEHLSPNAHPVASAHDSHEAVGPPRVVLVQRPREWTPRCDLSMPERAVILEVIDEEIHDFETFVRQYNAISFDEKGSTWAGIARGTPKPREEVQLTCLLPDISSEAATNDVGL